jgi:hypothetical protein
MIDWQFHTHIGIKDLSTVMGKAMGIWEHFHHLSFSISRASGRAIKTFEDTSMEPVCSSQNRSTSQSVDASNR